MRGWWGCWGRTCHGIRYDDEGDHAYTVCSCGGWTGDYFAEGEAGPFDDHLADVVLAWLGGLLAGDEVREAATKRLATSLRGSLGRPTTAQDIEAYRPDADAVLGVVRDAVGVTG